MALGAFVGVFCLVASALPTVDGASFIVIAFAGGALFGKGYGILEERGRL